MFLFTARRRAATKREEANAIAARAARESASHAAALRALDAIARETGGLGRAAAETNGVLEDITASALQQATTLDNALQAIVSMVDSNRRIGTLSQSGQQCMDAAHESVDRVAAGFVDAADSLSRVSASAGEITRIALQTRLVAFNASVEAKRAGEAGRGFSVVADAVKDLAARVEDASRQIMNTVALLDTRMVGLASEIRDDSQREDSFRASLGRAGERAREVVDAAMENVRSCEDALAAVRGVVGESHRNASALAATREKTEEFLALSETLIELTAESGICTDDTPLIEAVLAAASQVAQRFEEALDSGEITQVDLFDECYVPVNGSNPPQHTTRFAALTDRLLPAIQEPMMKIAPGIVLCAAVDRNGYLPTHNAKYSHPQGADPIWNAAHCRNRRVFDDRTGLAAARNRRRFLLQTYRRDMGGGRHVCIKDLSAPIVVRGRHWGALRLAYEFRAVASAQAGAGSKAPVLRPSRPLEAADSDPKASDGWETF